MSNVNEKTHIPLWWIGPVLVALIPAVLWIAHVDANAAAAKDQVTGLRDLVLDVRERIIRIEEDLKKR